MAKPSPRPIPQNPGSPQRAEPDALAVQFVESVSFDCRLAKHDILVPIAHATMLASVKLLTKRIWRDQGGLLEILSDSRAASSSGGHAGDIHMAVETELIARIKEPGNGCTRLGRGTTRWRLDIRLWCREAIGILCEKIADAQRAFVEMAGTQGMVVMPSFTHLQRAQPIVGAMRCWRMWRCCSATRSGWRIVSSGLNISPLGRGGAGSNAADQPEQDGQVAGDGRHHGELAGFGFRIGISVASWPLTWR